MVRRRIEFALAEDRVDGAGILLAAAAIGWAFMASRHGGSAVPLMGAVAGAAAALVAGRMVARRARWLVPALVAAASGVVLVVVWLVDVLMGTTLGGPLGYANATGAFFVQGSIAGLMVAVVAPSRSARLVAFGAAIVFAIIPFTLHSVTALATVLVPPAFALVTGRRRGARLSLVVCGVMFLAAFGTTVVIAAAYPFLQGNSGRAVVDALLTQRRARLWNDAWTIAMENPLNGVGQGRFPQESPTARADPDTRAAHNEFLQQGAESGFIGLGLLLLLFIWGFVRLWASGAPDTMTTLGGAGLAALGVHASVDYVLHFPPVTVVAAALVGAAQARPPGNEPISPPGPAAQ